MQIKRGGSSLFVCFFPDLANTIDTVAQLTTNASLVEPTTKQPTTCMHDIAALQVRLSEVVLVVVLLISPAGELVILIINRSAIQRSISMMVNKCLAIFLSRRMESLLLIMPLRHGVPRRKNVHPIWIRALRRLHIEFYRVRGYLFVRNSGDWNRSSDDTRVEGGVCRSARKAGPHWWCAWNSQGLEHLLVVSVVTVLILIRSRIEKRDS